jgi:hypothetical protein
MYRRRPALLGADSQDRARKAATLKTTPASTASIAKMCNTSTPEGCLPRRNANLSTFAPDKVRISARPDGWSGA